MDSLYAIGKQGMSCSWKASREFLDTLASIIFQPNGDKSEDTIAQKRNRSLLDVRQANDSPLAKRHSNAPHIRTSRTAPTVPPPPPTPERLIIIELTSDQIINELQRFARSQQDAKDTEYNNKTLERILEAQNVLTDACMP